MTRRARARPGEDQLRLDLDAREHPAVEHARVARAKAGLPPSLTSPELLTRVHAILDTEGVVRRARPSRRAS